jgi:hypothetical protein
MAIDAHLNDHVAAGSDARDEREMNGEERHRHAFVYAVGRAFLQWTRKGSNVTPRDNESPAANSLTCNNRAHSRPYLRKQGERRLTFVAVGENRRDE